MTITDTDKLILALRADPKLAGTIIDALYMTWTRAREEAAEAAFSLDAARAEVERFAAALSKVTDK
jgi:hypothetical protein